MAAEIERYFCLLLQWSKELIQLEGHFNNIRDEILFKKIIFFLLDSPPLNVVNKLVNLTKQMRMLTKLGFRSMSLFVRTMMDTILPESTNMILYIRGDLKSFPYCCITIHIHFWVGHGIMGRRFPDGGLLRFRKWVPQQLGDVNKQWSGDSRPMGAWHGDTAANHTDLLVRTNLAPDFPLFHGVGFIRITKWKKFSVA